MKKTLFVAAALCALLFLAACGGNEQEPAVVPTDTTTTTQAATGESTQAAATETTQAASGKSTQAITVNTQATTVKTTTATTTKATKVPTAPQHPDLPQLTLYQFHTFFSRTLPPVRAIQGTTGWTFEDGTAILSDSPHPLQLKPSAFDAATLTDPMIYLSFSWPPEKVTARRWPAGTTLVDQGEAVALIVAPDDPSHQLGFQQLEGDYIYEVSAQWTGSNHSSYSFRVKTAPYP